MKRLKSREVVIALFLRVAQKIPTLCFRTSVIHKNYCMLGMDDKLSNFLLCLRDKHASSWKMILDSNFTMTLNSSLTAPYLERLFVSKGLSGHMAALKDSGLWHLEMISLWSLSLISHQSSPKQFPTHFSRAGIIMPRMHLWSTFICTKIW